MCGILGFLDRTGGSEAPIGQTLLTMLTALGSRGPDSAGVALFGPPSDGIVLRVKLGENGDLGRRAHEVMQRLQPVTAVRDHSVTASYLRLVVDADADVEQIIRTIEDAELAQPATHHSPDFIEVVSMGRRLEIVKQVGTPLNLEEAYHISQFGGTHGIGHTRLSTESRVDLSHSQPFWAHGMLDVAAVHNGHITNYHKLRRIYEQRGVRFYTENDSEILGIYIKDRMAQGDPLEEAIRASLTDLDGSFSYLIATEDALAFAKDSFGLKPLVIAETDEWVAIATEELAMRQALGEDFDTREPAPREMMVWKLGANGANCG